MTEEGEERPPVEDPRERVGARCIWALLVAVAALALVPGPVGAHGSLPRAKTPPTLGEAPPSLSYHPAQGDAILVFAAHPDDETLGAGGFIHAAVAAGARVTIVIFTNGDGYLEGVDLGFHTLFSTPARFIEYGKARQQEALAAAERLGIPPGRVIFLGYPDRGLGILWGPRWDCRQPYTSPYTRRDRSPYPLTFHVASRYCGADVLADVEALLRRERPAVVVFHHPADTHRDHWASEAFVTFAIEHLTLGGESWCRSVRLLHYLVHRGAWPRPQTYAPDLSLSPPPDLQGGRSGWWQYPLPQATEDAKRGAVLEYRSQVQLRRTYMLSFVRRNELFDSITPVYPHPIGDEGVPLAATEIWDRIPPVVQLPAPSSLLEAAQGSSDLSAVAVARAPNHLYLAIRLRRPAIREVQYRIEMRLFYPSAHTARLLLRFRPPGLLGADRYGPEDLALPSGAVARSVGPRINVVLPTVPLGDPVSLYLRVVTIGPFRTVVDHTPWTLVRLTQAAAAGARP